MLAEIWEGHHLQYSAWFSSPANTCLRESSGERLDLRGLLMG